MLYAICAIAAGIVGYTFGSVIGYATGKADGEDSVADYYRRRYGK